MFNFDEIKAYSVKECWTAGIWLCYYAFLKFINLVLIYILYSINLPIFKSQKNGGFAEAFISMQSFLFELVVYAINIAFIEKIQKVISPNKQTATV